MALPRRYWAEMTTRDFADSDTSGWIAVLPVAAIEQHGPHLPVFTDTCIAEGMVRRSIELLPDELSVTFLPVKAIGKSNEHISSPGTITSTWETTTKLWLDIGESVKRAGVSKLIVVNSHGGNVPMVDIVARELRVRHDMLVVATAWSRFGQPDGISAPEEGFYGIHGGDVETSLMLHFRRDLVDMGQAQDLNPAGVVGNAAAANADKGKAVAEHQTRGFVELCADVAAFDPARLWVP